MRNLSLLALLPLVLLTSCTPVDERDYHAQRQWVLGRVESEFDFSANAAPQWAQRFYDSAPSRCTVDLIKDSHGELEQEWRSLPGRVLDYLEIAYTLQCSELAEKLEPLRDE